MRLYIDDIREPVNEYDYIARSSDLAISRMVLCGCPIYISFDHDLGGVDTAMIVVHWMVEMDLNNPGWIPVDFTFNVHSANPVGVDNINGLLNGYLNSRNT